MPDICKASSRANTLAPIFSIPPEILQMVFLLCREMICDHRCTCHSRRPQERSQTPNLEQQREISHMTTCDHPHHGTRHQNLLTLSYVCRIWYTFILHTPSLWDVVDLVYPHSVLTVTLPLRKDIPITVTGSFSEALCCGREQRAPDIRVILSKFDWLLDNCSQIKTLSISLDSTDTLREVIVKIGEHQTHLRHLKVLNIAIGWYYSSGTIRPRGRGEVTSYPILHLPKLATLSFVNVGFRPWLPNASIYHLRRVKIERLMMTPNSLRNFLDLLRRCSTTLEQVELHCGADLEDQDEHQAMADVLISSYPLELPHLQSLRIESCPPNLLVTFLNTIQAPRSHCTVKIHSFKNFLEYLQIKPVTPEWGRAIGACAVECHPDYGYSFSPIDVPDPLSQTSIRYPAISMGDILANSTEYEYWPVCLRRVMEITRGYVRITSFILDMDRFYELADHSYRMRIKFPRGDHDPTTFEPTAALAFADQSAKERVIKVVELILAKFPEVETLSVIRLPRREDNDLTAYQELAEVAFDRYYRNGEQKISTCSGVKFGEDHQGRIRVILNLRSELPNTTTESERDPTASQSRLAVVDNSALNV